MKTDGPEKLKGYVCSQPPMCLRQGATAPGLRVLGRTCGEECEGGIQDIHEDMLTEVLVVDNLLLSRILHPTFSTATHSSLFVRHVEEEPWEPGPRSRHQF